MDANSVDANVLAVLLAIIAASPGVLAIWQNRNKETANTATVYEELARKAASRLDEMQTRLNDLEAQIDRLQVELKAAEVKAAKLEDWAKRLSGQVTSLGHEPVPLEVVKK